MSFSMLFNFLRSSTNKQQQQQQPQGNNSTTTSSNSDNNNKRLLDPLEMVAEVNGEADQLELQVDQFEGEYQGKDYRYLDEMLTRCMLKLDNIDSNGREDVRNARRITLNRLDRCVNSLENKATGTNKTSNHENNEKTGD